MSYSLSDHVEALLFYKGEGVSVHELSRMTDASEEEVREALRTLGERLDGGVRLVVDSERAMLATAPEYAASIEELVKEELSKDLGKAGSEVLAIVVYMGPITRARIDHVRGVNSASTLRHLEVRGLIEKIPSPSDRRSMMYRPTLELLTHLGAESVEVLPDYEAIREEIAYFEERREKDEMFSHEDEEDSVDMERGS
ncbi:MAG: SMC-Scp complex subunit ScpB [Parcubacteria group bacterium]|nr:SMC-Scp complex subunit ScpB [Parcubacteria group bacterium]